MSPAVKKILRWALTAAIIVFLVLFARTIDWQAAWTSMRSASLPLLAAAIFVNFLSVAVKGVRWWLFLQLLRLWCLLSSEGRCYFSVMRHVQAQA